MAEIYKLKHCPFCEHQFREDEMDDVIYPTNRERTLWQCGCTVCTATVFGTTPDEAVADWNKRSRKDFLH